MENNKTNTENSLNEYDADYIKSMKDPIFVLHKVKKIHNWNEEEDSILLKTAAKFEYKNWNMVAEYLPSRTAIQCSARYKRIRPGIVKGAWMEEEDELVLNLLKRFGKNWSLISKYMPSRSGKQIRDRFLNALDPNIVKEKFTQEEDREILKYYSHYGTQWSRISKFMPKRTGDMIKNRFYSSLRKLIHKDDSCKGMLRLKQYIVVKKEKKEEAFTSDPNSSCGNLIKFKIHQDKSQKEVRRRIVLSNKPIDRKLLKRKTFRVEENVTSTNTQNNLNIPDLTHENNNQNNQNNNQNNNFNNQNYQNNQNASFNPFFNTPLNTSALINNFSNINNTLNFNNRNNKDTNFDNNFNNPHSGTNIKELNNEISNLTKEIFNTNVNKNVNENSQFLINNFGSNFLTGSSFNIPHTNSNNQSNQGYMEDVNNLNQILQQSIFGNLMSLKKEYNAPSYNILDYQMGQLLNQLLEYNVQRGNNNTNELECQLQVLKQLLSYTSLKLEICKSQSNQMPFSNFNVNIANNYNNYSNLNNNFFNSRTSSSTVTNKVEKINESPRDTISINFLNMTEEGKNMNPLLEK